jgi:hypothetical protein
MEQRIVGGGGLGQPGEQGELAEIELGEGAVEAQAAFAIP